MEIEQYLYKIIELVFYFSLAIRKNKKGLLIKSRLLISMPQYYSQTCCIIHSQCTAYKVVAFQLYMPLCLLQRHEIN